jgi:hypothetical protein
MLAWFSVEAAKTFAPLEPITHPSEEETHEIIGKLKAKLV